MELAVDEKIDGRRARGERARTAVVDAILDLLQQGDLKPTAERVVNAPEFRCAWSSITLPTSKRFMPPPPIANLNACVP